MIIRNMTAAKNNAHLFSALILTWLGAPVSWRLPNWH